MEAREHWVTTAEAAELKGVKRNAILRAIAEGRLIAARFGKVWLIHRQDLEGYEPLPATR